MDGSLRSGEVCRLSHPLLNAFLVFEGPERSRLLRLSAWLAQTGVFLVLIIVLGKQWYPGDNDKDLPINSVEILVVGAIGAACLLPPPFLKCLLMRIASFGSFRITSA